MSYRFCLGASGSGKSSFLHKMLLEAAERSLQREGGVHDNYVIIVPDQYSMQTQKEIVTESPNKGILNIDVLSFGRLTHKVFEEVGASRRAVLDDTGKSLLIRRGAGKCESGLKILGKSIHYPGMVAEVKSIISEFMQYGIGDGELSAMQDYSIRNGQGALHARLSDLQLIYRAFLEEKKERFITGEEMLDLLAEAVPSSDWAGRSVFVLDGFTGFTPVQYRVITALIRHSRGVIISLTYGRDSGPSLEWVRRHHSPGREDALFYLTRKTICDVEKLAAAAGLEREEDLLAAGPDQVLPRFAQRPVLAHLEKNIFRTPAAVCHQDPRDSIRIMETDTPEEEVRQICAEIKRLVLTRGYQYRNISAVCGDLASYGPLFKKYASLYEIPVYVDETSAAGLSPLTEALRSVLQIRPQGYSYAAVFRYLRSGMSSLSGEEIDLLENYCLAHGIKGRRRWAVPFDAPVEPLRIRFLDEIEPVCGRIDQERLSASTAAERTRALYDFMIRLSMEEKMQEWADGFTAAGDDVRAGQFSQLYRSVIALLEQIHDLIGDEKISSQDYLELLESGFEEIRLGTLPQQADRVLVGDMERTRIAQCRILFFAGVNDGNIPKSSSRGGLLSDLDREFLRSSGTELSPTPRQQMYLQRLYLYLNMTKPTDTLYLSFARTSPDKNTLHPSYLISMIRKMFPGVVTLHPQLLPFAEQLSGERDSIRWLSDGLRDFAQGKLCGEDGSPDAVRTAYGFLMRRGDEKTRRDLEALKGAAFTRYDPVRISRKTAEALYGNVLTGGISRMETAAKCQLRQFLRYGLGIQERDEYVIENVDTGEILHRSLDRFGRKLAGRGLTWNSFTREEGAALTEESLRETAASYNDLLMYSTKRSEFQLERMRRILLRSADTLQYQLQKGDFVPEGYEFSFGPGADAEPITFELSGGRSLRLVGRIDRLDLCREDGSVFVKILDYKSGSLDLDENLMKRGIQLQLLIYMNAVMEDIARRNAGARVVPSAMLYYRVADPVIDGSSRCGKSGEESLAEIRAHLRPTGLIESDPVSYRHLDRNLSGKSDVVPLRLGKDGLPISGSRVYSRDQFNELSCQVKETVKMLAEEILDGNVEASPAVWKKDGDRTACDYCPYRSVCGFDPSIDGYQYREK